MSKFYVISQCPSMGITDVDENVSDYVVIEALSASKAMEKLLPMIEDQSDSCEEEDCCGPRWPTQDYWQYGEGIHTVCEVQGDVIEACKFFASRCRTKPHTVVLHHSNGTKQYF